MGDSVTVTFIIQDSVSLEPVPFATIKVDGELIGQSEFDGIAKLTLLQGAHSFSIGYIGYYQYNQTLYVDKDTNVVIYLMDSIKIVRGIFTVGKLTFEPPPLQEAALHISLKVLDRLNNLDPSSQNAQFPTNYVDSVLLRVRVLSNGNGSSYPFYFAKLIIDSTDTLCTDIDSRLATNYPVGNYQVTIYQKGYLPHFSNLQLRDDTIVYFFLQPEDTTKSNVTIVTGVTYRGKFFDDSLYIKPRRLNKIEISSNQ